MKFRFPILLIVVALGVSFASAALAEMSAFEIAKKSVELEKSKTRVASYRMSVINERGKSRVYAFKVLEKDFSGGSKKMIRFSEPSDANGTGLLTFEKKGADDQQWLFLPSRKSVRQLAAADKSDQFMGSDLFVEDMGTISAEDYEHTILKEEDVDGFPCWVVESKPKPGISTAYARSVFYIDKQNFAGRKAELYDKSGKLIKHIHATSVEKVGEWWTIKTLEVQTPDKKTKTQLELTSVEYNKDIPDNTFTTQSLERY